ncbi:MAG TPA: hypothetical protein DCY12_01915 [Candidatus Atribacteria bacterium]|nr:hypothetical protein [Candidatus Atribacteria bacterium]
MKKTIKKRLKVVWICHLNNPFVSSQLKIGPGVEFSPWMARLAEIFKTNNEMDVYIVAPHNAIVRKKSFYDQNIHYHFFPYTIPSLPKRIFHKVHMWSDYAWNKRQIGKIINKIKPDIIHLFGTENAYYSSSIFQFKKKYPVLITIQGFVNHSSGEGSNLEKRKGIERGIIKTFKHFGVRDEEMKKYINSLNLEAKFYHHELLYLQPHCKASEKTKYDIIFFARVCKDKGIEDLIDSLVMIKEKQKDIKMAVVGPASKDYYNFLELKAQNKGLSDSIDFIGPQKNIEDVHSIVAESKICVLPTYFDTIPGTLLESMLIGIPCVSYSVGGIPTLNNKGEIIKLVDKGSIKGLADAILGLLENDDDRKKIADRAKKYVLERWNEKAIYDDVIRAYRSVIRHN